ncbi:MAG: hypothetical protein UY40_C0002G0048 [candidate division CPR1 bacterium GW2011_GWC1_49_13]|uniref:Sulfatase N-terminal domain-containing protein n=1 Tax=candidate division CPR1 bacterium GW2011_GWC1_49_13 TaxID=1618342 RepID=A0A0G1VI61_9BACT|nr:MAG: hypothetical protein UY40_C0002G0048 [candidate division CPR1 bacterium GW2011_GWC1_49_13]
MNPDFKNYFVKFIDSRFIFRNIFIPLIFLSLSVLILACSLPVGVSKTFANEIWPLLSILVLLSGTASLIFWHLKKKSKFWDFFKKENRENIYVTDLIFILLPLTPVVQYIINNQDILSFWESLYVLGLSALVSLALIITLPKFLGRFGSPQTLMVFGLTLAFIFLAMPGLSLRFFWFEVGSLKIQLAVFASVFLFFWFLTDLKLKNLLYVMVSVYFLSNSLFQAFLPRAEGDQQEKLPFTNNKLVELVGGEKPKATPNIYLLVYDAYAHNETMEQYGIDNIGQERYLENLGFKLYPKTYSIGAASLDTMSRVLNASTDYYGNGRRAASGDGVVQNLLEGFGYETYGIFPSDYFFRGYGSNYDHYFPVNITPSGNLLMEGILTGEFKFDLEFDKVPHEQFIEEKVKTFKEVPASPRFIDMHTSVPSHSQNSGACLPNETDLYKERLDQANREMRGDLKTLIKSDPSAIIIVASDHGPYLTKNCTGTGSNYPNPYDISEISRIDIQDRFGTFLAIRWPDGGYEEFDEITVLQDLFPAIFSYLFKDQTFLGAKVEPVTVDLDRISGASVFNGLIRGGIDNGEPLFLGN